MLFLPQTVDKELPHTATLVHVQNRTNPKQKAAEKQANIDYENKLLLGKLEQIYTRDIHKCTKSASYRTSLGTVVATRGVAIDKFTYPHIDCVLKAPPCAVPEGLALKRLRNSQKIATQNLAMLKRIQASQPEYVSAELDEFGRESIKLAELASRPEVKHLSSTIKNNNLPDLSETRKLNLGGSLAAPLDVDSHGRAPVPNSLRPDTYVGGSTSFSR